MGQLLTWTEKMSVGVDALDADHRKLMALVNELHAAVRGRAPRETIGRILDELITYTEYHFAVEEQLQKLARFPDRDAHAEKHRRLEQQVRDMRETFRRDPVALNKVEVFDFLSDWLVRHILGDDMKYRPYLTRKPADGPVRASPEGTKTTG